MVIRRERPAAEEFFKKAQRRNISSFTHTNKTHLHKHHVCCYSTNRVHRRPQGHQGSGTNEFLLRIDLYEGCSSKEEDERFLVAKADREIAVEAFLLFFLTRALARAPNVHRAHQSLDERGWAHVHPLRLSRSRAFRARERDRASSRAFSRVWF